MTKDDETSLVRDGGPHPAPTGAKNAHPAGGALSARVAKGTAVIVASRIIIRSLGFINTLVLARLLVPEDFGLVALGVTIMQLLQNISDIGVSQTVIKFRDAGPRQLDTLFTMSAIRGVAVTLLLLIAAPFAGQFYGDDRVSWVFLGVSAVPLLQSLINPRFYEFERDLDFSREMIATASNKLIGVAVSITIAVIFRTYWAIILGIAAGALTQLILSYILRPYRPRLTLSSFKELIGFTGWLTGVSFVVALNNKLDVLFLGRIVGAAPTGAYYVGDQLASLPTVEIATPIVRAIYPGLSQLQSDERRMNRAFLRGVEVLGAIAMPAALGCAFVAHDLVLLLLGAKWEAAIPVVQWFAPVFGLMSVFFAIQHYAMALGKTKLIFYRELIFFFVRTPLVIWAALAHGLLGAIYAAAGACIFHVCLSLALYQQISGKVFWEPALRVWRSVAGCAAMAVYFFYWRPMAPMIEAAPMAFRFAADIAIAAGLYAVTHMVAWVASGRPDGFETTTLGLLKSVRGNG